MSASRASRTTVAGTRKHFDGVLQSIAADAKRVDAERARVRAAPFQRCRQMARAAGTRRMAIRDEPRSRSSTKPLYML